MHFVFLSQLSYVLCVSVFEEFRLTIYLLLRLFHLVAIYILAIILMLGSELVYTPRGLLC